MSSRGGIARMVAAAPVLALLLAGACGGGDHNPAGPTGPGGGNGGGEQLALVALGFAGLPADAQLEDCTLTRFYSGDLQLDSRTGSWQITLEAHDDNYGDFGYEDDGSMENDGDTVWFTSAVSGSSYRGTVDGDEIRIMYDWCYNGVPDVQLVFAQ
jgi:hypothetical protein